LIIIDASALLEILPRSEHLPLVARIWQLRATP
jgi:hypothetical protein